MTNQTSVNNKRIAKNTIMLYLRMFLTMVVGLYTSRVVLQTLGVEDFGIYNVVGGVVAMMGILNNAMAVASQRYLTFELGKNDIDKLKLVFNVNVSIYLLLSFIFILISETIGLWFLNTQLIIPDNRILAANFIYFLLSVVIVLPQLNLRFPKNTVLRILICGIPTGLVIYAMKNFGVIPASIQMIVSLVFFYALYVVTKLKVLKESD